MLSSVILNDSWNAGTNQILSLLTSLAQNPAGASTQPPTGEAHGLLEEVVTGMGPNPKFREIEGGPSALRLTTSDLKKFSLT